MLETAHFHQCSTVNRPSPETQYSPHKKKKKPAPRALILPSLTLHGSRAGKQLKLTNKSLGAGCFVCAGSPAQS